MWPTRRDGPGERLKQRFEPDRPSPLATFVAALTAMVVASKLLAGAAQYLGDPAWQVFREDLEMLTREGVIVGLRVPWIRRVAVPVFQANRALNRQDLDDRTRALTALEIMRQCQDENVKAECSNWIRGKYNVG